MKLAARAAALVLALLFLFSSCSKGTFDEPEVSAAVTEEITTSEDTLLSPPPHTEADETTSEITDEITEETTDEITDEITEEETSEETAEESTETIEVKDMTAENILIVSNFLASVSSSYRRSFHTEIKINARGEKSVSVVDSELSVYKDNAVFRRASSGESYYLLGGRMLYESEAGKFIFDGYDRAAFLELISDPLLMSSFTKGKVFEEGEELLLSFSDINETGREEIIRMISLPDGSFASFDSVSLTARMDADANLISADMSVSLTVSAGGERIMDILITSSTKQTDKGSEISLELPSAEGSKSFSDLDTLALYFALVGEISSFTENRKAYEYSVSDDMIIKSGSFNLALTSDTVYAYNSSIGASIEKKFDKGDGTGIHTTLTHFNNSCGYSRIDNGTVFIDTTINSVNLAFTLAYPFSTSFFSLDNCTGMNKSSSGSSVLALDLNYAAAENIARNLLLRAGVLSSSPELSIEKAYTYLVTDSAGRADAIGYIFSATAKVSGVSYTISREVELKIVSRNSAKVKVIYCDPDEEEW